MGREEQNTKRRGKSDEQETERRLGREEDTMRRGHSDEEETEKRLGRCTQRNKGMILNNKRRGG